MINLLTAFMDDIINGQLTPNLIKNPKYPDIQTNNGLIYNEFSLQHALGAYLEKSFGNGYRVEFERNSEKCFGIKTDTKHEIDIVVYNNNERKCAIELKFPRNGQYPEQMFSFVKDIAFLEELANDTHPFEKAYAITLVDDEKFYKNISTKSNNYIYKHFRCTSKLPDALHAGIYPKPTGNKPIYVALNNSYQIDWQYAQNANSPLAYYIVKVK